VALLLIGLLVWALMSNADDEDVGGAADDGTAQIDDGATDGTTDGQTGIGETGTIVAGSEDVLGAAGSGGLASLAGQQVTGTQVPVESVVADEAFWVGPSADERVLVFIADAGGESGVDVDAGDTVSFTGTLEPVGGDFAANAGIDAAEGADDVVAQDHYISAEQVEIETAG
jgi:hypothetical protein